MERIHSGNRDLDRVLCGGFPANAIHIVMGNPGAGKTILAEQLAFANASAERPALYLTTFSEPLSKFLTFLQEYRFADSSRVGTEVLYESLGDTLAANPERLCECVEELLKRHRPQVIVFDSFKAIADLMPDRAAWRRQLYALAGLLSAFRATTFWVGEYESSTVAGLPEFAVADGVVELTRVQHGARDFRSLRVVKLRGSDFANGLHAFRISSEGIKLFPRLVTPLVGSTYDVIEERVSSGVPGLDELIETGWLRGTTTLVRGPSGAGKTLLSIQFLLEGVRRNEATLLVTFEENPVQVARVMRGVGWDPVTLAASHLFDVFFTSPVELQIDSIIGELFERVETRGVRRLVVDGLADLAGAADDPLRTRDYLFALTQQLSRRQITSMFTLQDSLGANGSSVPELSYLGDNVLRLEMTLGESLERSLRIVKSRGSSHDGGRHELVIAAGGVSVR